MELLKGIDLGEILEGGKAFFLGSRSLLESLVFPELRFHLVQSFLNRRPSFVSTRILAMST